MVILSFVYMEQGRASSFFPTRRTVELDVSTLTHASFRIDVAQVHAVTKVEVAVGRKLGVEGHVEQSLNTRPSGDSRRETYFERWRTREWGGGGGSSCRRLGWGFPRPSRGVIGRTNRV